MNNNYIYYTNISLLNDSDIDDLLSKVSQYRNNRIKNYKNNSDKKLSLCSELLLKKAFKDLKINSNYNYRFNDYGKPYLDDTNIFFNISHSGDYAICALSDKEIGIDIQQIRKTTSNITEKCFSDDETKYINSFENDDKLEAFYRIWTLKESFIKNIGVGLALPLKDFSINIGNEITIKQTVNNNIYYFEELNIDSNYKCSLCNINNNSAIIKNVSVFELVNI